MAGLRKMGVSEADIEAEQQRQDAHQTAAAGALGYEEDFDVHEDNWDVWVFFLGLQTQWAYASNPMGWMQRIGLPSNRIESEARMMGWPRSGWTALLSDVRLMEHTLLACDAELAEQQAT